MRVRIEGPQSVQGEVKAPGSKAYTHRTLLASLLTPAETRIRGALDCDDTCRTLDGIRALGANVRKEQEVLQISGPSRISPLRLPIDCGESGTTLRLLTAISSTSTESITLIGDGSLADRPMVPLLKTIEKLGGSAQASNPRGMVQVTVTGPLKGGEASIHGNISSQFMSGLLFAAPLALKDVTIRVQGKLESRPYVEMTREVLERHGISIEASENEFRIPAPQEYQPSAHRVPGDFSSAGFLFAAAGTAGDEISIRGLESDGLEPDAVILDLLAKIGAEVRKKGEAWVVGPGRLRGFKFDASDHPDLVPILEVLACKAQGLSEISGVKRLRYKETNRLQTVPEELTKMGARISAKEDRILIHGGRGLSGQRLDSHHDHRVAMACATASLTATGESVIEDAGVVSKSYPGFFQDLEKIGVRLHVE